VVDDQGRNADLPDRRIEHGLGPTPRRLGHRSGKYHTGNAGHLRAAGSRRDRATAGADQPNRHRPTGPQAPRQHTDIGDVATAGAPPDEAGGAPVAGGIGQRYDKSAVGEVPARAHQEIVRFRLGLAIQLQSAIAADEEDHDPVDRSRRQGHQIAERAATGILETLNAVLGILRPGGTGAQLQHDMNRGEQAHKPYPCRANVHASFLLETPIYHASVTTGRGTACRPPFTRRRAFGIVRGEIRRRPSGGPTVQGGHPSTHEACHT